jgi:hypothetical protein
MRCRVKPLSTLSLAKRKLLRLRFRLCRRVSDIVFILDGPDLQRQPTPARAPRKLDRALSDWSPSAVAIAMSLLLSCL